MLPMETVITVQNLAKLTVIRDRIRQINHKVATQDLSIEEMEALVIEAELLMEKADEIE